MQRYTLSRGILALSSALFFLGSCDLFITRQDTGILAVRFAPEGFERSFTDAQTFFPRFASVVVNIRGSGMESRTIPVSVESGYAEIAVEAGPDRIIEVVAVPDWGATSEAYPAAATPTLVKAYSGTGTADIVAGKKTAMAIRLSAADTAIILPSYMNQYVAAMAQFDGPLGSKTTLESPYYLSQNSDIVFDRYGYMYYSGEVGGIYCVSKLESAPVQVIAPTVSPGRLAMDVKNNRLFWTADNDGTLEFRFSILSDKMLLGASPSLPVYSVNLPSGYAANTMRFALSADRSGYIYCLLDISSVPHLVKLSVGPAVSGAAQAAAVGSPVPLSSCGISDELIYDMQAHGDHLFLAVERYESPSGRLVKVSSGDLTLQDSDIGYSESTPGESDPYFANPTRFLGIFRNRLYVSDEGTDFFRVIEVDPETGAVRPSRDLESEGITFFVNMAV